MRIREVKGAKYGRRRLGQMGSMHGVGEALIEPRRRYQVRQESENKKIPSKDGCQGHRAQWTLACWREWQRGGPSFQTCTLWVGFAFYLCLRARRRGGSNLAVVNFSILTQPKYCADRYSMHSHLIVKKMRPREAVIKLCPIPCRHHLYRYCNNLALHCERSERNLSGELQVWNIKVMGTQNGRTLNSSMVYKEGALIVIINQTHQSSRNGTNWPYTFCHCALESLQENVCWAIAIDRIERRSSWDGMILFTLFCSPVPVFFVSFVCCFL